MNEATFSDRFKESPQDTITGPETVKGPKNQYNSRVANCYKKARQGTNYDT